MADDNGPPCVLKLCYPGGRSYTYVPPDLESVGIGDQLELFGRRWHVSRLLRDVKRRQQATTNDPPVYECHPLSSRRAL